MKAKFAQGQGRAENTLIRLFIILFYISFIESYGLLGVTIGVVIVYSIITCGYRFLVRLAKPALPFVILLLLPSVIRYILTGTLEDIDFTLMIICKMIVSSILLGSIVSKHSALYLVEGVLNLGLPEIFNKILALTFRYFHMIHEDVQKGRRALISRGISERKGLSSLSIFGEWIGGFFLKSTHHSDMVFHAMISRGFQGVPRNKKVRSKGMIIESSILTLFLIGLLIIDRTV